MSHIDRRSFMKRTGGGIAALSLAELALAAPPQTDTPIRIGMIGVGRQGRAILAELQKLDAATVTHICDSDERRLNAGVRRAPEAKPIADYRALLDNGAIDAVVIATPTHLHRAIAIDAIAAGKHAYCEAPLAGTIEDCKAITEAARGAQSVFQVGLQARSNPVYQLARTFFLSDSVRDLVCLRAQRHRKTTWRTPGGSPEREKRLNWRLDPEVSIGLAGEWGTHQFDVFHWYLDRYPVRVRGGGGVRLHRDGRTIHDTIACDLEFADGAILQYQATLANSYDGRYEVLYGSNAAIKLGWSHGWMFKEADAPTQGWEVYANRQQFHNDEGITLIADATQLASQGKLKEGVGLPQPSLYYGLEDFVRSIIEGSPPTCPADEGMRASVIGILTNQAILEGRTLEVDESLLKGH